MAVILVFGHPFNRAWGPLSTFFTLYIPSVPYASELIHPSNLAMNLVNRTKRQIFEPGDIIMRQGEIGENAYLIEEGQVEIFVTSNGQEQVLGRRSTGAIVGEMAIVDNKVRTASVRAVTPSTLLAISREDFGRRLAHADPVMKMVMQVILARYRAVLHGTETAQESSEDAEKAGNISQKAFETIRMTHDFREAILGYQLRLHYQPIIEMKNSKVVGSYALAPSGQRDDLACHLHTVSRRLGAYCAR